MVYFPKCKYLYLYFKFDKMNDIERQSNEEIPEILLPDSPAVVNRSPFWGKLKVPPWKISIRKLNQVATGIRSWTVTLIVILIASALIKLIIQQLNDKSYHIKAFRMPEDFVKKGYDGVTVAYQLLDKVNEMIAKGNESRTVKEIEEYNNSADKTDLQVEIVGGAALSLDNISGYLRQALGIKEHSISGEITKEEERLKLVLRMSGEKAQVIYEPIGKDEVTALKNLMHEGSANILKMNNPFLLSLYYMPTNETDNVRFTKCISALRYSLRRAPKQAANAYTAWGLAIFQILGDTWKPLQK